MVDSWEGSLQQQNKKEEKQRTEHQNFHLALTVNFTDCTDGTEFVFTSNDDHFMVQTDGTLMVRRWVTLQEGQRSFFIYSWDSQRQKLTVSVVVQYQGDHEAAQSIHNNFSLKEFSNNSEVPVLHFPRSSEGLQRKKRDWSIPPISLSENHEGPYPLLIAQIRSDVDRQNKIYYIISGPGADQLPVGLFTMDRTTGNLYVTQALDRETKDRYMLQVHAVAEGSGSAEDPMDIVIIIIDQNDNKPVFTFLGNVAESSSIGLEVIKVKATDADQPNTDNSDIRYRIVSQEPQQPSPSMFVINPVTGAIRVSAAGLDQQKYPEYTLVVEAADAGGTGLTALAKVILTVTDINVNAPVTNLTTAEGGSRSRRNAYPYHNPKTDDFSSEDMFRNPLRLLPQESVPFSSKSEEGMRRRKRSWIIPPLYIPENSRGPFPLRLAQVRSYRSKVKKIFYSIHGPGADQPPVGLFIMDRESGWLSVTEALDRETQDSYKLEAHAVEEGGTEALEAIDIFLRVIDQNDNRPVFNSNTFEGEVPQSSPKGFKVIKVEATDADEPNSDNSEICYRIIKQEPEEPSHSMFTINMLTGDISVNAAGLDREKHPQYTLTVEAADMRGNGLIGRAKVILTVTTGVASPGWVIPDITVPENSRGPYPLMLTQFRSNEDEMKKILYSISGPGADQPPVGLFTMNRDTGALFVMQELDREEQDKYTLQVHAVAQDEGTAVEQTQAVIKVIDQNDNKPVFNKDTYEGEVSESSPKGIEVIKVEATDADEPNTDSSEIRYSIINQEPEEPSMFTINPVTGAITLSAVGLNREKHPQYTLLVQAGDSAEESLAAQVKVILTVTANSAGLSQPSVSTSPAGKEMRRRKRLSLVPLYIVENDRGPYPLLFHAGYSRYARREKVYYTITGPGADQPPVGLFVIDRKTGALYVTQALDREKRQRYGLNILTLTEDSEEAEEFLPLIVQVFDQNDNKPVFVQSSYTGTVAEGSPKGFEVITVQATDADEPYSKNSIIHYRILSQEPQEPCPSMFVINPITGNIRLNAGALDRKKHPQYTLLVEAADLEGEGLTAQVKVVINVSPSESNLPVFNQPATKFKLPAGPLFIHFRDCNDDVPAEQD
ncbi:cadherin-1-like [Anableps anableps]